MKNIFLLFLTLIYSHIIYSQQSDITYTDISPDGKSISTYKSNDSYLDDQVVISSDDIPYGLTPDWSSTLDRQIGGMAWGDYDNDGDLDLATGCYFSNSYPPIPEFEVLIYRNDNGILTTTPAWISTDMRSTTDVKFADLNGDEKPELIAANGDNSFVPSVIYFNSETGLSNAPSWISQDNNWTVGEALCDIDDDGDLDLAFGNQGNSVIPTKPMCIFYNNGGTFQTVPNWLSADEMITNSVAFGDLDNQQIRYKFLEYVGDGIRYAFHLPLYPIYSVDTVLVDDLPYYEYCYDPIGGWLSLGTKPGSGITVKISYRYISKGDLAASKWVYYESGVYFNNNGVLNTLPGWTVGNTETQKGIGWADFDQDGFKDLAISGSGVQTVIYKNVNGVLTGPIWTSNSVNPSAQELITGDVDRDGYPELAVVHFGTKRIEIFKNRSGVLDTTPTWLYIAGSSANSIAFGDVNGDGALDLAVGTARSPVVVFINQLTIPVELISFTASVTENDVQLNWSTATETNNSGFEIQKTSPFPSPYQGEGGEAGRGWESIGFVPGYGTSTEKHSYSFNDENLVDGNYQYRLKQIDFDGTSSYSEIVEVEINSPGQFVLEQNYPNPFNPSTKIKYSIPAVIVNDLKQSQHVTISVYDVLGNEVVTLVNEEKPAGEYEVIFDSHSSEVRNLPSGIYFYKLETSNFAEAKKMILLR
ncbi:MAG: T9SS type A sorting domain-containing protein [Ignavibacteriaceae bacterium]|nr:T9SS type A sorting domain-containing protein [Ignavibacteriaceae bacterium]